MDTITTLSTLIPNKVGLLPCVDIRGDGGFVLIGPSIHISGNQYSWEEGHSPEVCEITDPPSWLLERMRTENFNPKKQTGQAGFSTDDLLPCAETFEKKGTSEGSRDICLFILAKHCHRKGINEEKTLLLLRRANVICNPPLPDNVLLDKIKSAYYGQDGEGYTSLGCEEPTWQEFCIGKDDCPVFSSPPNSITTVLPFPLDALPKAFRRYSQESARAFPCPLDFTGTSLLITAGSAIGTTKEIEIKPGWREPPILWGAIVGFPGSKKSPALKDAAGPVLKEQEKLRRKYEDKTIEYKEKITKYMVAKKLWEEAKKKAAIRKVEDPGDPPPEPGEPVMEQRIAMDATVESIAVLMDQNRRGLILIYDELAALTKGLDQYKGKGNDRQHFLSWWTGGPDMVNRMSRKPMFLPRTFLCIIGNIPPDVLGELTDLTGRADGFVDRFLFSYPDQIPGGWSDYTISNEARNEIEQVFAKLYELQHGSDGNPQLVELTEKAKDKFKGWLNSFQHNASEEIANYCEKLVGYCARLALTLHMVKYVTGETTSIKVESQSMSSAIALIEYYKSHARKVFQWMGEKSEDRSIRKLIAWIQKNVGQVTARNIVRAGAAGIRSTSEAENLLNALVDRGYGFFKPGKNLRGKKANIFVLNARQHDKKPQDLQ
ncbi:MAG: DUF3987 domain-containing protein [Desulfocucumaceae bacterium]